MWSYILGRRSRYDLLRAVSLGVDRCVVVEPVWCATGTLHLTYSQHVLVEASTFIRARPEGFLDRRVYLYTASWNRCNGNRPKKCW